MDRTRKVPKSLLLVSMLSISITLTLSIIYTVLSILALVYRYECDVGNPNTISGADFFLNLIYRTYIQKDDCPNSLVREDLTQSDSVFVLNIITLCANVLCCGAAIAFMSVILSEDKTSQVHLFAYVYIGVCVGSQVVDLTFATHFGMDYSYLTDLMNLSNAGLGFNYENDTLRLGALFLMTVTLKGFVASAINCVLFVLITIDIIEYRDKLQKEAHSIHKMGALNAYDQPRRLDPWQPEPQMFIRSYPQINPAYTEDPLTPPRTPRREQTTADYLRSEPWQNGRPFSYLEERPTAPAPTASRSPSAITEPAWRRDAGDARGHWPPPPVPAPDYSPLTPRRLKPALKPYTHTE